MARDWVAVKEHLEAELDEIMWEEPLDIKMSRLGVFPSAVGARGQFLANLFFQVADSQAMSWWTGEPAMSQALSDPELSLDACKRMWKYMTVHMAHLMGDVDPPKCPHPWLNMPKLSSLCDEVVECLETVTTKEELADLLWSWYSYVYRINCWSFLTFPWELGAQFPLKNEKEVEALVAEGVLPSTVLVSALYKDLEL
jgi:hypothetical protein